VVKLRQIRKLILRRILKMRKVFINVDYFRNGDYTEWYMGETSGEMTYKEWLENVLIPRLEQYETLVLYEDGTLYGVIGGCSELISDNEFDPKTETHIFEEIAEEFQQTN
jgi:hypothetical protein